MLLISLTPTPLPQREREARSTPLSYCRHRCLGCAARRASAHGLAQLRIKDKDEAWVARETREAMAVVPARSARSLSSTTTGALRSTQGAPGVHLGQGDLDHADIGAIRKVGMRLGVSTHDDTELEGALRLDPDYVALGPIYPTVLKAMPFGPQGLQRIGEWKRRIGAIPLVATQGLASSGRNCAWPPGRTSSPSSATSR